MPSSARIRARLRQIRMTKGSDPQRRRLIVETRSRLERQRGGRLHLQPAVEARLVVEELHAASGGPLLLDLDGEPEPAGWAQTDAEIEVERDVELGPAC